MELKDFIKESLVQISKGIQEANDSLGITNAVVNPRSIQAYSGNAQAYGRVSDSMTDKKPLVHMVQFDVAIEAKEGTQTGGGIKLSVASIGIGTEAQSKDSRSTVSRLSFKIPMVYPDKEYGT